MHSKPQPFNPDTGVIAPKNITLAYRCLNRCRGLLEYCQAQDPEKVRADMGEAEFRIQARIFDAIWKSGYTPAEWNIIAACAEFTLEELELMARLMEQLNAGIDAPAIVAVAEEIIAQANK